MRTGVRYRVEDAPARSLAIAKRAGIGDNYGDDYAPAFHRGAGADLSAAKGSTP